MFSTADAVKSNARDKLMKNLHVTISLNSKQKFNISEETVQLSQTREYCRLMKDLI